ncbi:membrane protein [Anditalea andensis]|uniref:Membrane protein n=2 Tax=Anditalea andensis TaxID=1048983 RepID=A0A074KXY2_9BACT|nr:membrane protein [Anditalea andensis]
MKAKNIIYITILSLVFTISHGRVKAQVLDTYLVEAGENNPEVRATFSQYMAAMERVPQVGSLPDPELTMGVFLRPMERLMGNQRADISLMQMFPWFGMLRTQRDEASLMAQASYERFRESKNQLYYQVKSTYYSLHQLQNEIEIMQQNLDILRSMERLALVRYQGGGTGEAASSASGAVRSAGTGVSSPGASSMAMGGASSPAPTTRQSPPTGGTGMGGMGAGAGGSGGKLTDVLRIQIQIKAMESQLATLADRKTPLITRFNYLLGRPKDQHIDLENNLQPRALVYDEESYIDSLLLDNPMLKMYEAEAQAYTIQGEMAKLEGRPMIGVGLNYMVFSPRGENGMPGMGMEYMPAGMGNNMVMPMVSLSLPIYRKRYKAMQTESRYNREAMELQRENAANSLITQLDETINEIRDTERKVRLYEEQVRLTQQTLDLMITSYASEGSSFEELLSVQRELLDYRLELLNTIIGQYEAYAMLDMVLARNVNEDI